MGYGVFMAKVVITLYMWAYAMYCSVLVMYLLLLESVVGSSVV